MTNATQPLVDRHLEDINAESESLPSVPDEKLNGNLHVSMASPSLCSDYTFLSGIPAFVMGREYGRYTCHAYSSDGQRFAAGSFSASNIGRGILRVWDGVSFEEIGHWRPPAGAVEGCKFVDGTRDRIAVVDSFAIYSELILDQSTGRLNCVRNIDLLAELDIQVQQDTVLGYSFSKDGRVVALHGTQSTGSTECNYFTMSGDRVHICELRHGGFESCSLFFDQQQVGGIELSECGKHLLTMSGLVKQPAATDSDTLQYLHSEVSLDFGFDGRTNHSVKLYGVVSKWAFSGALIVAFTQYGGRDRWEHVDEGSLPMIYLYLTADIQKQEATSFDEFLKPKQEISLELSPYLLEVCPYLKNSAEDFFDSGKLFIICAVRWSEQQVLATINVKSKAIVYASETLSPMPRRFVRTRKWFREIDFYFHDDYRARLREYTTPRLSLSPKNTWLIYKNDRGEEDSHLAVLFCLKQGVPVLNFSTVFVHSLPDSRGWHFEFDPTGERAVLVSSKGMIVYFPSVLSACPPREQMTEIKDASEAVELHDALRNIGRCSHADKNPPERLTLQILKLYLEKYGDADGRVSMAILSLKHRGTANVSVSPNCSHLVLGMPGLNYLVLVKLQDFEAGHFEDSLYRWPLEQKELLKGFYIGSSFGDVYFVTDLAREEDGAVSTILVWLDLRVFEEHDRLEVGGFRADVMKVAAGQTHILLAKPTAVCRINLQSKEVEILPRSSELPIASLKDCCDLLSDDGRGHVVGWDSQNKEILMKTEDVISEEGAVQATDHHNKLKVCWISNDRRRVLLRVKTHDGCQILLHDPRDDIETCRRRITIREAVPRYGEYYDPSYETAKAVMAVPHVGVLSAPFQHTQSSLISTKMLAFTPWCFDEAVPSYRRIQHLGYVVDKQHIDMLIRKFGWNIVNHTDDRGRTFLQSAVEDRNVEAVKILAEHAVAANTPINFLWTADGKETNALESATRQLSRPLVELVIKHLLDKSAPVKATARVFSRSFVPLQAYFPNIFEKLFTNGSLAVEIGSFQVPASSFDNVAHEAIIHTTDSCSGWLKEGSRCEDFLKEEAKDQFAGRGTTVEASAKIVCIEDAAKVGSQGILRKLLLMSNVPVELFESDIVKWVVDFKWKRFWRRRCIWHIAYYLLLLLMFTIYAVFVGSDGPSKMNTVWGFASQALPLTICGLLSAYNLLLEYRQFVRLGKDASVLVGETRKRRGSWKWINPYLLSVWNFIEVLSYLIILVPIPVLHGFGTHSSNASHSLSVVIAVDSILLWFKLLYWAQAFQATGPLVTMIQNVVRDIRAFVLLAFMVLFGFGVAFHVLLRHSDDLEATATPDIRNLPTDRELDLLRPCRNITCAQPLDDFNESFDRLDKSFTTLYFAMLGDFDADVYRSAKMAWTITLFFCLYMATMMVVLLNLLIAIMGDIYDRVKLTESAEMIKCRASVIDDCEAYLSVNEIKEMNAQICKYIYALVPVEIRKRHEGMKWRGRIFQIERSFRNVLDAYKKDSTEEKETIMKQLNDLGAEVKRREEEMMEHSARIEELKSITNNMHERIARMQEGFDSRMANMENSLRIILNHLRPAEESST